VDPTLKAAPWPSPFLLVVVQLVAIDLVFSLDSIITAIGMVDRIEIMIAAVVIAMLVMVRRLGPGRAFIAEHPTTKMPGAGFLVLIGVALVAEGFDFQSRAATFYFAMAFAGAVEAFNVMAGASGAAVHKFEGGGMPVLLITGAGRGHWCCDTRACPARGYDVAINYKTDAKSAADVAAAVKAQGRNAVAIRPTCVGGRCRAERSKRPMRSGLTHFVYNAGIPGTADGWTPRHRR